MLLIGVFVSFSRAAWGSLLGGAVILFVLTFIFEADARDRCGCSCSPSAVSRWSCVGAIGGLLSIPSVNKLFDRARQRRAEL